MTVQAVVSAASMLAIAKVQATPHPLPQKILAQAPINMRKQVSIIGMTSMDFPILRPLAMCCIAQAGRTAATERVRGAVAGRRARADDKGHLAREAEVARGPGEGVLILYVHIVVVFMIHTSILPIQL